MNNLLFYTKFYNIFFLFKIHVIKIEITQDMNNKYQTEPSLVPIVPNGIFIPKNENIIVGIEMTIVILVKNFMTLFKLLEITVAKASVILPKISLYKLAISIPCLFSRIASSNKS